MRLALAVLLLVLAPVASAQVARPGSARQLGVEVETTDQYKRIMTHYGEFTVYDGTTREWRLLADGRQVDAVDFYRIAGDVRRADALETAERREATVGVAAAVVGLGGVAAVVLAPNIEGRGYFDKDMSSTQFIVGAGVAAVSAGVIAALRGLSGRHRLTLEEAVRVADDYNGRRGR